MPVRDSAATSAMADNALVLLGFVFAVYTKPWLGQPESRFWNFCSCHLGISY